MTVGLVLIGTSCGQPDLSEQNMSSEPPVQGDLIESAAIRGEPIAPMPESSAPLAADLSAEGAKQFQDSAIEAVEGAVEEPVNEVAEASQAAVEKMVAVAKDAAADASLKVIAVPEKELEASSGAVGSEPKVLEDGLLDISFDQLASFDYEMPEDSTEAVPGEAEGASDQIPEDIRNLNGKAVALEGFMLPLKVEKGLVTEMLIMRDQSMCCYGTVPKINEWVSVKMVNKGVQSVMDQTVTMFGRLKVGEIRENGYLVGIYEMDGDRMDGPMDL